MGISKNKTKAEISFKAEISHPCKKATLYMFNFATFKFRHFILKTLTGSDATFSYTPLFLPKQPQILFLYYSIVQRRENAFSAIAPTTNIPNWAPNHRTGWHGVGVYERYGSNLRGKHPFVSPYFAV